MGAVYGLKGSVVKVVTPTVSFRAIGRFGFTAIDADVGIVKKFSDHSNVTLSVIYGIQVQRRTRSRSDRILGNLFENEMGGWELLFGCANCLFPRS